MKSGRLACLPAGPPLLQVVVDTEEEFDWGAPFDRRSVGVTAVQAQAEMQAMLDGFGVMPTYVVDYPVATTPSSVGVLKEFLVAGRCLIGAHLHPWVSPPHEEVVSAVHSYPGNLPDALERAKLTVLTEAIAQSFGMRPVIYKAGRYGVGKGTAETLKALDYQIDLSVVPHSDFGRDGGPDFRCCPSRPYWVDGDLLEIPLSRGFSGALARQGAQVYPAVDSAWGRRARLGGIMARLGLLDCAALTPEGMDAAANRRLIDALLRQGHRVLTMTWHSPSLAVGHTPYVRTPTDLAQFHATVRETLDYFFNGLGGVATTPIEVRRLALEG